MIWLALSAGFAGWMHSLAPGHWLPIVLMSKTRKWSLPQTLMGILVASSGHILVSLFIGVFVSEIHFKKLEESESWVGLFLAVSGLLYALYGFFSHHRCSHQEHSHHGPEYSSTHKKQTSGPYLFLFSLGLYPCFPALPSFLGASSKGPLGVLSVGVAFAVGVLVALGGCTLIARAGLFKLDHPLLEHYSDVITGLGICVIGLILYGHG